MKSLLSRRTGLPFLLAATLLLSACVTSTEVRDIVRQSNTEAAAALGDQLVAETGAFGDLAPAAGDGQGATPDAIARLSTFVDQHPDNKVTQNALLLRLALLHLNAGALELARATFDRIDAAQLRSPRDQGLLAVREHLLWWRGVALLKEPGVFAANHRTEAEQAMRAFAERAALPATPPDLRAYLLEARAHIGIKLAADLINRSAARTLVEDSVNAYAALLDDAMTRQLESGALAPGTKPFDHATRLILRTQFLLEVVAAKWRNDPADHQPTFANPGCQAHYQRQLPR